MLWLMSMAVISLRVGDRPDALQLKTDPKHPPFTDVKVASPRRTIETSEDPNSLIYHMFCIHCMYHGMLYVYNKSHLIPPN